MAYVCDLNPPRVAWIRPKVSVKECTRYIILHIILEDGKDIDEDLRREHGDWKELVFTTLQGADGVFEG